MSREQRAPIGRRAVRRRLYLQGVDHGARRRGVAGDGECGELICPCCDAAAQPHRAVGDVDDNGGIGQGWIPSERVGNSTAHPRRIAARRRRVIMPDQEFVLDADDPRYIGGRLARRVSSPSRSPTPLASTTSVSTSGRSISRAAPSVSANT
jgi:hypothetical protein